MFTDEAIKAAIAAVKGEAPATARIITVDGKTFALEKDTDDDGGGDAFRELIPADEPAAEALNVSTLTGVLDYVSQKADGHDLSRVTVHICGPREVRVVGPLRSRRDREIFVLATPAGEDAPGLNCYADQAEFILRLQRFFEVDEEQRALIALAGTLIDEATRTAADDGVTQIVATKQGSKLGTATVKNPWYLVPKRSFAEVTLEPVPFILRVKFNGAGNASSLALFEADGGAWKVDAIRKIRSFIEAAKGKDAAWGVIA